jgi:hypothetical protein
LRPELCVLCVLLRLNRPAPIRVHSRNSRKNVLGVLTVSAPGFYTNFSN